MKKILCIIFILTPMLSMAGGNRATNNTYDKKESAPPTATIGILISTNEADISKMLKKTVETYLLNNKTTIIHSIDLNRDMMGMEEAVNKLISMNIESLIIMVQNNNNHNKIINGVQSMGIPLIFVHYTPAQELISTYPQIITIAPNNKDIGRMQAQFLIATLKKKGVEKGNVGIVTGTLNDTRQLERTEGVGEYIKNHSNALIITHTQSANWKKSETMSIVESWVTSNELVGIVTNNNAMALGATIPLREQEITGIVLVGAGGTNISETFNAIKKGHLTATIYVDITQEILSSIQLATQLSVGEPNTTDTDVTLQLVSQDNVSQYAQ